MSEVQKPSVAYEDNQGDIFLENIRQVGMRTKNIDIRAHFLRGVVVTGCVLNGTRESQMMTPARTV